ncbi:MAG: GNAT family protein [candidate division WOR-3 bacterium]
MEKEPIELSIQVNDLTVVIRPLKVEDALTSYRWRNDPEVWKYTGNRPDQVITPEIETEWIKKVLTDKSSYRFAICVGDKDGTHYIGNIQLTNIQNGEGEYHIFIGEKSYWRLGIGTAATKLLLSYAFNVLGLKKIRLKVRSDNLGAIALYTKVGFVKDNGVTPNPELVDGAYWVSMVYNNPNTVI